MTTPGLTGSASGRERQHPISRDATGDGPPFSLLLFAETAVGRNSASSALRMTVMLLAGADFDGLGPDVAATRSLRLWAPPTHTNGSARLIR